MLTPQYAAALVRANTEIRTRRGKPGPTRFIARDMYRDNHVTISVNRYGYVVVVLCTPAAQQQLKDWEATCVTHAYDRALNIDRHPPVTITYQPK